MMGKKNLLISAILLFSIILSNLVLAQNGLVSYWEFEQNVEDSIGVNDGTRYNFTNGYVTGKYGYGLDFNSTAEQYVDYGNDTSLNFGSGDFSVELWVKTTQVGHGVLSKYDFINDIGYIFSIESYGGYFGVFDGVVYPDATSTTNVSDGTWHHIVGIRNGDNVTIYVDGDWEDTESQGTMGSTDVTDDLLMGYYNGWGDYFNGTIDNVRIWDRALTEEEIESLYLTNELPPPPTPVYETMLAITLPLITTVGVVFYILRRLFAGELKVEDFIKVAITVLISIALTLFLIGFI